MAIDSILMAAVNELQRRGTLNQTERDYRLQQRFIKHAEWVERKLQRAIKQAEWEERQRQRAIKQAEWVARQRQQAIRQTEWEEQQRQRAIKQAEWVARQRQQAIRQTEWEEQQRQRANKQAEWEERQRQQAIRQTEWVEQQRQRAIKQAEWVKRQLQDQHGRAAKQETWGPRPWRDPVTNQMRPTTPAFRAGDRADIKTTILLSAPGQAEERAGRPAAKDTGKTLQKAVKQLHAKDPVNFPSERLDDYTVANAVEDVLYQRKSGRTEGRGSDVKEAKNLRRINAVLAEADNVVALGDKAQLAVSASKYEGGVYIGKHPSKQALNRQYESDKATPSERCDDRIAQWIDSVVKINPR